MRPGRHAVTVARDELAEAAPSASGLRRNRLIVREQHDPREVHARVEQRGIRAAESTLIAAGTMRA